MNPMQNAPLQRLDPADFIDMHAAPWAHFYRIELAYARKDNLLFGERIYRKDARLWLHKRLARVVFEAAGLAQDAGYRLVLYDGLRTVEAQTKMLHSQRVKDNPHWLEEPRLLSRPGMGAHPRGMAIDAALEDEHGALLDMGTAFDFLAEEASAQSNPAHRAYIHLSDPVLRNRALLDGFMRQGAQNACETLVFLPQEWWDFRLPADIVSAYAPLRDADLPDDMRMV
jgi:zinc D-Ala-D-Ala dipeptidase